MTAFAKDTSIALLHQSGTWGSEYVFSELDYSPAGYLTIQLPATSCP